MRVESEDPGRSGEEEGLHRKHQFHNQAAQGAESALTAMLGRTAAYKGHEVTWDDVVSSDEQWESNLDLNEL